MKPTPAFLLLFLICSSAQAIAAGDTLAANRLKPFGRYRYHDDKLELISSAAHFGCSFTGPTCAVYASIADAEGHNYIQYELDGKYQKRLRVNGNASSPIIINAEGAGTHTLWIYKATEAHTGGIIIARIAAPAITALSRPKAPLIEFIGNSITCGAAADDSEVPCGTGVYHDQHNAYMAYGPRVARALGANFIVSSVSGIGIYRTWNRDGPSMPQVYEKEDFQLENSAPWNFSLYTPDVVSIALGTNDLSRGDGKSPRKPFDSDTFVSSYVQFVRLVKSKYPHARIALLSSPMVHGTDADSLAQCLQKIKAAVDKASPKDFPVQIFFFKPMQAHGCSGHPTVAEHEILATEVTPFFRQLLQRRSFAATRSAYHRKKKPPYGAAQAKISMIRSEDKV